MASGECLNWWMKFFEPFDNTYTGQAVIRHVDIGLVIDRCTLTIWSKYSCRHLEMWAERFNTQKHCVMLKLNWFNTAHLHLFSTILRQCLGNKFKCQAEDLFLVFFFVLKFYALFSPLLLNLFDYKVASDTRRFQPSSHCIRMIVLVFCCVAADQASVSWDAVPDEGYSPWPGGDLSEPWPRRDGQRLHATGDRSYPLLAEGFGQQQKWH